MTDRLDRIEAILSNVAEQQSINTAAIAELRQSQQITQQIVDSNARAIEANSAAIEAGRDDLRTTQQIVDSNARAIEANSAAIEAGRDDLRTTQQIVDSNARAIEANSAAIASSRQETTELKALLREEVGNLVTMIVDSSNHTTDQFDRLERQFEQDRAERLALSADVRSIVEVLRERFRSNGHS
jgi:hypothetical protein